MKDAIVGLQINILESNERKMKLKSTKDFKTKRNENKIIIFDTPPIESNIPEPDDGEKGLLEDDLP